MEDVYLPFFYAFILNKEEKEFGNPCIYNKIKGKHQLAERSTNSIHSLPEIGRLNAVMNVQKTAQIKTIRIGYIKITKATTISSIPIKGINSLALSIENP